VWQVDQADDGSLTLARTDGKVLVEGLRFARGDGDERIEMMTGSYRVAEGSTDWTELEAGKGHGADGISWTWPLADKAGDPAGTLQIAVEQGLLLVGVDLLGGNRVRWDAACTGDDHFAGLGQHAMDVDHVGQAFPLWVSEPGIGKVETEEPPEDWFLTGTRHATSYPDPFLLRPEPMGLHVSNAARSEVDLCTGDRWRVDTWASSTRYVVLDGDTPLDVIRARSTVTGLPKLPPDWAFAPWNDAVGGTERVQEVAATLRAAGAPSSVIWTEDWKGAEETAWGYHLLPSWSHDESLYPDPSSTDADLEAAGFKWFAYFSPFVVDETTEAEETADFLIQDAAGEPYWFTGVSFEPTTVLDLSSADAGAWAQEKMEAALALGFDGWMADYAEWLPTDAHLSTGGAEEPHNLYPLWWQEVNAAAIEGYDATFFTRSGWSGSPARSPVGWAGDQRTSFDPDDGLPSVVPMGIGAGLAGLALYGSDIAGYQSIGNDPSTKELWFRWCALGAFSPVMRTHHGAFKDDNWQFDSDEETLAHYARYARVHTELFPYLRGLAELSRTDGTPMLRAPFLTWPDEPWGRSDAWLLGDLLVVPVTAAGATTWDVSLPGGTTWYDWWTGLPATSGVVDAPLDGIPVYAPAGAIVPLYVEAPDTLVDGPLDGVRTRTDADAERRVKVYAGAPGRFEEADGTVYETDGVATSTGSATGTFAEGTLEAGGLQLSVRSPVERTWTLEVYK